MTADEGQQYHQELAGQVQASLEALPPYAQGLVRKWRRAVELTGRAGPMGCALNQVRAFIRDVQAAFDGQWQAYCQTQGKKAGEHESKSGV